jgi:hypothetical protein
MIPARRDGMLTEIPLVIQILKSVYMIPPLIPPRRDLGNWNIGISPPIRNFAPPYKFWIFYLKTKRLQVEKIYCVIYLFITRRQNYIHILGFLAAGGVHSRHNHSFEVLRLVSYSTHLMWNHCPQRSHKIMLSYSSGSLHLHNI